MLCQAAYASGYYRSEALVYTSVPIITLRRGWT
jgi:hypothetical protein